MSEREPRQLTAAETEEQRLRQRIAQRERSEHIKGLVRQALAYSDENAWDALAAIFDKIIKSAVAASPSWARQEVNSALNSKLFVVLSRKDIYEKDAFFYTRRCLWNAQSRTVRIEHETQGRQEPLDKAWLPYEKDIAESVHDSLTDQVTLAALRDLESRAVRRRDRTLALVAAALTQVFKALVDGDGDIDRAEASRRAGIYDSADLTLVTQTLSRIRNLKPDASHSIVLELCHVIETVNPGIYLIVDGETQRFLARNIRKRVEKSRKQGH